MVVVDRYGNFTYRQEAAMFGVIAASGIYIKGIGYQFDVHVYSEGELIVLGKD